MKKKILEKNTIFENDTLYEATEKKIVFTAKDSISYPELNVPTVQNGNIAFLLVNKKNITLDFKGATLYLKGRIQPFVMKNCENITVKNAIIEFDRASVSEAEILDIRDNQMLCHFGEKFPYRMEEGKLIPYSDTWENTKIDTYPFFMQGYDGKTRQGKFIKLGSIGKNAKIPDNYPWKHNSIILAPKQVGENVRFTADKKIENLEKGDVIAFSTESRTTVNMALISCRNIRLENYRILNGIGMGIYAFHTENISFDRLLLTYDERSHGFVTNSADGIHTFASCGKIEIKNSIIEGTIDDALNIHSNFYGVKEVKGNVLGVKNISCEKIDSVSVFAPGDRIAVYTGKTLSGKKEYAIRQVIPKENLGCELVLDKDLSPDHQEGDVIENLSTQCELDIENCRFGKSNAHLRFQTRGKITVRNCQSEMPFYLTGDMSYWLESSPVENMEVSDCDFTTQRGFFKVCPEFFSTKDAPYYHGTLSIKNCSFEAEKVLRATALKKLEFIGNRNTLGKTMSVDLKNCGEAQADNCEISRTTEEIKELKVN